MQKCTEDEVQRGRKATPGTGILWLSVPGATEDTVQVAVGLWALAGPDHSGLDEGHGDAGQVEDLIVEAELAPARSRRSVQYLGTRSVADAYCTVLVLFAAVWRVRTRMALVLYGDWYTGTEHCRRTAWVMTKAFTGPHMALLYDVPTWDARCQNPNLHACT
jgi:hypothetical protein